MDVRAVILVLGVWAVVAAIIIGGDDSTEDVVIGSQQIVDHESSEPFNGGESHTLGLNQAAVEEVALKLEPLLDPAKIATLKGDRPINTRSYKILYWLEMASREGADVSSVIDKAQKLATYDGTPRAKADKVAILWSWKKLDEWGCYGAEGMDELRRGGSPTIQKGTSQGDGVAMDHVLPVAIVPELRSAFFNLQAMPAKLNSAKGATIGDREKKFARRLFRDGLLSREGLEVVDGQ